MAQQKTKRDGPVRAVNGRARPTRDGVSPTLRRLLDAAAAVRLRAYAPYSGFQVGAAVLCDDGRLYAGCNVENVSYGLCVCAERNAVAQAVARGARRVLAVAVITPSEPPSPPCGMCLQTLAEFGDAELPVLLAGGAGSLEVVRLGELMPRSFDRTLLASGQAAGGARPADGRKVGRSRRA